jgi:hypothetical protein
MSDQNAVAPVGPVSEPWISTGSAWGGVKFEVEQFAEGFGDGAAFSAAVMGAGLNVVTSGVRGQVKSQFG